ncbi:unnamed protein product [Cyclocybe aegerita]|uniref:Uncharacterized protein n=1 Tax=Cyclocybe aegerita TaxID=1973307 RepID=A0A8S0WC59_CYCAE|nr:unnamed protein product [Cyclocybe aegerita]
MSSVHLVRGRRWLGWYNSPGSYYVAKKYGVLAKSRVWDGLYPGVNVDPTTMLELDGKVGPRYVAAHSGTRMEKTGHLAYLLTSHYSDLEVDEVIPDPSAKSEAHITIASLEEFKEFEGYPKLPADHLSPFDPVAIVPIAFSVGASVMCAIFGDWYCFAMIMLGVICNGVSCFVIGSGVLKIKQPNPSPHSPPGDGVLFNAPGSRVVLLKGSEKIVSSITRGRFYLEYESQSQYHDIGYSSVALTMQFLLQLFIVPQGQLFGQIMFLSSLGISWIFNAYLASVDREDLQKRILMRVLLQKPTFRTVALPKWTSLVVFAAVYLQAKPEGTRGLLEQLIPNDTAVWRTVKSAVVEAIERNEDPSAIVAERNLDYLDKRERGLLEDMMKQASIGYNAGKDFKL